MTGEIWIAFTGLAGAVLGAFIGVLGTVYTTVLKLKGKEDYFDDRAKKFLRSKLKFGERGISWDELSKWGRAIGLTRVETKQLLLLSDIEPIDSTGKCWALQHAKWRDRWFFRKRRASKNLS